MDTQHVSLPLALHQVLEGRAIAARESPLFKFLPVEVFSAITRLISDPKDLASLALVNSDFRQLARASQFRTVRLDFTARAHGILGVLQRESVERRQRQGCTTSPSLGVCIRRITTNNKGYRDEIEALRPTESGRATGSTSYVAHNDDEETLERRRAAVADITFRLKDTYWPNVLLVISSLPNLETLDISQADLNQGLLNSMVGSTIRHLVLRNVQMSEVAPGMGEHVRWPLEILDMHMEWGFNYGYKTKYANAPDPWNNILRLCAGTLQYLRLSQDRNLKQREHTVSFSLEFPKLSHLDLGGQFNLDQSALRSLILTSRLSFLKINHGDPAIREFLDKNGNLPMLRCLVLFTSPSIPDNAPLTFLENNPQLTAFAYRSRQSTTLLGRVLPILANFSMLKTLSVTWVGVNIPDCSLGALSLLTSLEVLHLSSGFQYGWQHDWLVDHSKIRSNIHGLRRLKRLAFTRDTYAYPFNGGVEQYSDYNRLRSDAWDQHRQYMNEVVMQYARNFLDLEWVHIGELSYDILREGSQSCALHEENDPNFNWMRSMFHEV